MNDIFNLIKDNKDTFKSFREWLFIKLNRNANSFTTFGKYPNRLKIPYLIEYLETKNTPILPALCYYNALSSNQAINYEQLCVFMVTKEFKRIELKKTLTYVPF